MRLRRADGRGTRDEYPSATGVTSTAFTVYVEGPSDCDILRTWAGRFSPRFASALAPRAVILGGRQPKRAIHHFRRMSDEDSGARGLCVLDRDEPGHELPDAADSAGLEFYTWPRRHIESYLLVPDAIRRVARVPATDTRFAKTLRSHVPERDDEEQLRSFDAKRVLSPNSSLSRALGARLTAAQLARALRRDEFHADVLDLLERLSRGLGLGDARSRSVGRVA